MTPLLKGVFCTIAIVSAGGAVVGSSYFMRETKNLQKNLVTMGSFQKEEWKDFRSLKNEQPDILEQIRSWL